jgi:hypothetical protein
MTGYGADTNALLGAILIRVAIHRGLDLSIVRHAMGFFPHGCMGVYGDRIVESILALVECDELAEDILFAFGRYFGAPPALKLKMQLGVEISEAMRSVFAERFAEAQIGVADLAERVGSHPMTSQRLEMALSKDL